MDIIKKNLKTMLLSRNYRFVETNPDYSIYFNSRR